MRAGPRVVLGEELVVLPVHLPLGSLLDAHSCRGAADGVRAAERPPVGSRRPVVLEELNRGGVPMWTAAPELGGPAGLLCLSHSLPLLVRRPRGPPLVLPAHAHPSEPAAPGGPTRLSRASPAGLPALGGFLPKPRLPTPTLDCLLPAALRVTGRWCSARPAALRVTGPWCSTRRDARTRPQSAASRLDPQRVFRAWAPVCAPVGLLHPSLWAALPVGLPPACLPLRQAGPCLQGVCAPHRTPLSEPCATRPLPSGPLFRPPASTLAHALSLGSCFRFVFHCVSLPPS